VQDSVEAGLVSSGGDLGPFASAGGGTGTRSVATAFNGRLAQFGGGNDGTVTGAVQVSQIGATPPLLESWNDSAASLFTGRSGAGGAQYGAVTFVAGGVTATPIVLNNVERFVG
jgi:hypothetical protein